MSGIFGVAADKSNIGCVKDLFFGTDYQSHLGTQYGGMAIFCNRGIEQTIHRISNDQFRSKFWQELPKRSRLGIGIISDFQPQPLVVNLITGTAAIVFVGKVANYIALARRAKRRGVHFSEISHGRINSAEIIASLINEEATIEDGIKRVQEAVKGSCSMLLLTKKGIYAARDILGRTTLVIGKNESGAFAVTSETCAFPNNSYKEIYELGPGEVVFITAYGFEQISPPQDKTQICAFLWVYYGFPASVYEGKRVECVRNRCGAALARRDKVAVDCVAGIPDSGVPHAIGYANEACLPYCRPFVKYTPTWPRSFMPQVQSTRNLVAKMKLIPIPELITGRRILFCEDSIVRGTQLTNTIKRLFELGALEVHMRPACPPLLFGCKFLDFSRSRSELDLAGRRAIRDIEGAGYNGRVPKEYTDPDSDMYIEMVERIRAHLGLTTLMYQRMEDLVEAIGLPKSKLCTYCWDGVE